MAYTVKKLALLSGVSVRALHFYDEIGLLKPSHYGENGYRYYEEEQLLMLQQILFYRELGFPLNEIQNILARKDFDKITALRSHRSLLAKNVKQTEELINTIDKTIARLKGESKMSDKEMYFGFEKAKQEEYEKYLVDRYGEKTGRVIEESKKRASQFTKQDFADVKKEFEFLHSSMADVLRKNLKPADKKVQELVARHYALINRFYTPTKEMYAGLGSLYNEHPDFKKMYDSYHPKLAEFMAEAMKVFSGTLK